VPVAYTLMDDAAVALRRLTGLGGTRALPEAYGAAPASVPSPTRR
jgi:hypothetical protein